MLNNCTAAENSATTISFLKSPITANALYYGMAVVFRGSTSAVVVQFAVRSTCCESVERKTAGQRSQMECENSCLTFPDGMATAADSQK